MGPHDAQGIHRAGRGAGFLTPTSLVPGPAVAFQVLLIALVIGVSGAVWAVALHRRGTHVAYTRKVFHFVIFTAAAAVHMVWSLPGLLVFATVIVGVVVAALASGDGHPFYEALARDSDRPHRTLFIVLPLLTTAIGGLLAVVLTGSYATVGFLAAGWGDAVGEPVGKLWGRHPYRVPSLAGVSAHRTLEGSAAVLVVSAVGSAIALAALGAPEHALRVGMACGVVAGLVEAASNHGLDNLTVQVATSLTAMWLVG